MIYLFTGNNRYLIQEEAQRWKKNFGEKFGVENVTHITSLESTGLNFIVDNFFSRSLFSEKKLLIIDGFPYSGTRSFSGAAEMEETIIKNIKNIPEETLVVFLSENPDKRSIAYKNISKLAETKHFSIEGPDQVFSILHKKYGQKIETLALQKLIFLKGGHLLKSISEIEKLSLLSERITLDIVIKNISPEFEESIFVFIDTILSRNPKNIFSELDNLLTYSSIYPLYQSIIANLRIFLYIEFLKSQKIQVKEIGDIMKLGNRQFLINKRHASSLEGIEKLYNNLLNFDKNMKFGKFISSQEEDMKKELQAIFLKFIA